MTGTPKRVVLIGYGAIGQVVARGLLSRTDSAMLAGILVRSGSMERVKVDIPGTVAVVDSLGKALELEPDLVVECAGQHAVHAYATTVLAAARDLMIISTGALATPGLLDDLRPRGGARLLVAPGAIAGLDGLAAMRGDGLEDVVYTSTKPSLAWRGTPAEDRVDLSLLTEPTTFFEGSAREAALTYPKNANLAATVALAGLGLDRTRVRLVADPGALLNSGRIEARSTSTTLTVEMAGAASANPKTSAIVAHSLVASIVTKGPVLVI